ncbi:hypothetical protein DY000_02007345 [Brassica cretica]|uniref:Uncharacterized protein n=1 Tax=Brassica cretica TaxID=69181 RepID=A0ABQ7BT78_BRACR|nr:hypothetical protein DY000_02007345 [Brassica cretica]
MVDFEVVAPSGASSSSSILESLSLWTGVHLATSSPFVGSPSAGTDRRAPPSLSVKLEFGTFAVCCSSCRELDSHLGGRDSRHREPQASRRFAPVAWNAC